MLPVGEAETVGAKISRNAERRVHKIEASLDRFTAALRRNSRNAHLQPSLGHSRPRRFLSQTGLSLNQKVITPKSGKRTCLQVVEQPLCQSQTAVPTLTPAASPRVSP